MLRLPRNRMSELFTYGSVGGVGGNPGPYPEPYGVFLIIDHFSRKCIGFAVFSSMTRDK